VGDGSDTRSGIMVGIVVAFVMTIGVGAGTHAQNRPPDLPATDRPPSALVDTGNAARYLFDAARDSRWDAAALQLDALQKAARDLPGNAGPADLRRSLGKRVRELTDSVPRHQQLQAMQAANDITRITADLIARFPSQLPAQIPLLEYFGRQLEIGAAARQPAVVKRATRDLRQTWNEIETELLRHGRSDDVRRITDLVVSLEGTTDLSHVEQLATQELDDVHHLEDTW
jgi:hypothetical protein